MLPTAGLGSELRWLLLPRTSCPKRFHAPRNRCIHPSPPPFALCSSIFPLGVFRGAEEVQLLPGSCWTSSPSAAPPGSRCACGPRLPPSLCSVFSALCLAVSVPGGLGPASLSPLTLKAELGALGGGSRGGGGSGQGGGLAPAWSGYASPLCPLLLLCGRSRSWFCIILYFLAFCPVSSPRFILERRGWVR